jgi:hypothetical protein
MIGIAGGSIIAAPSLFERMGRTIAVSVAKDTVLPQKSPCQRHMAIRSRHHREQQRPKTKPHCQDLPVSPHTDHPSAKRDSGQMVILRRVVKRTTAMS